MVIVCAIHLLQVLTVLRRVIVRIEALEDLVLEGLVNKTAIVIIVSHHQVVEGGTL